MNYRLLHRWAREEALPLPSRTHPQNQKQTSAVYTEELTDLPDTGGWLKSVVRGYFNYYAVPGNLDSLAVFRQRLLGLWWQNLRRRSQQRHLSWTRMIALRERWIPQPCVLHPYPAVRFAATHPR